MNNIIQYIENKQMMSVFIPNFRPGDLVEIKLWVVEGNKKRIQIFEGIVIAIFNRSLNSSFTVYKWSNGEGIERVFQTYSPIINSIIVKKPGRVRKAKLYYLLSRSGKSARIKERL